MNNLSSEDVRRVIQEELGKDRVEIKSLVAKAVTAATAAHAAVLALPCMGGDGKCRNCGRPVIAAVSSDSKSSGHKMRAFAWAVVTVSAALVAILLLNN
jgi:hypothetical protein